MEKIMTFSFYYILIGCFIMWLVSAKEKEFFKTLSPVIVFIGVFIAPLCLPFLLKDLIEFIKGK